MSVGPYGPGGVLGNFEGGGGGGGPKVSSRKDPKKLRTDNQNELENMKIEKCLESNFTNLPKPRASGTTARTFSFDSGDSY